MFTEAREERKQFSREFLVKKKDKKIVYHHHLYHFALMGHGVWFNCSSLVKVV